MLEQILICLSRKQVKYHSFSRRQYRITFRYKNWLCYEQQLITTTVSLMRHWQPRRELVKYTWPHLSLFAHIASVWNVHQGDQLKNVRYFKVGHCTQKT